MKNVATITSKGQVTVPLAVRRRLGLIEGDRIEFVTAQGMTIVRPVRDGDNPFAAYAGALATFPGGVDEINEWVGELRDDAEDKDTKDTTDRGRAHRE